MIYYSTWYVKTAETFLTLFRIANTKIFLMTIYDVVLDATVNAECC